MLALLHDRELDAERIHALWQEGYEDFLGLHLVGEEGRKAITLLREGLTDIPAGLDTETLDRLAADFADIYLTHGVRASPCESVWLDEDGLAMQAPMFDVREWYRRYGLAVANWRQRSDDHLVYQLLFLAQLLEPEEDAPPLEAWLEPATVEVTPRSGLYSRAEIRIRGVTRSNRLPPMK
jgi:TorA maturation chaperone TorD